MNEKLLSGVKVVELATYVAAPSASKTLSDWGADVIKVEAPNGDFMRYIGKTFEMPTHVDENPGYDLENAGKRNICLNLKSEEAMQIFHKLLEESDVFLTNVRTAALERMGLSYEKLSQKFPGLIFAQILGYGDEGSAKDKPGFDYTAYYARGGISGTLYEKDTAPLNPAPGLGDHNAGVFLAGGVSAALFKKHSTGKGEKVTVSLLQTAIYGVSFMVLSSQYGNVWPTSRKTPNSPLLNTYKSKDDRWIQLACTDYVGYLPRLSKAINREDILQDERYNCVDGMKSNASEIVNIIEEQFAQKNCSEWERALTEADLPFEKLQTWDETVKDDHIWANDIFHKMEYANGNSAVLAHTPVKFKNMGLPEFNVASKIGGDTHEILSEIGYSSEEIKSLRDNNAVK